MMNDEISRRRFLALAAASAALASGTSCRRAADGEKVVPYTRKPLEIVPGVATYYASAFQEGDAAYGVLVKTREGRPIHIEGNALDPLHGGRASARAVADLLGLYDPDRVKTPLSPAREPIRAEGRAWRELGWEQALERLTRAVGTELRPNKAVLLMTPAVISPSRRALIAKLSAAIPRLVHVQWEPAADHAARKVARDVFGATAVPSFHLDKAAITLSLGADFLGAMGDATATTHAFTQTRRRAAPSRLYVIEAAVSLTGSNADRRLGVRPSALGPVGFALAKALAVKGRPLPAGVPQSALDGHDLERVAATYGLDAGALARIADDLDRAGNRSLILAGPEAPEDAHAAAHLLNAMLGSAGETVALVPSPVLASPRDLDAVVSDMAKGAFGTVIFWDVNPLYNAPNAEALRSVLGTVTLDRIRIGSHDDETAEYCPLILPTNHWLESWGDFDAPGSGALLLAQPTTGPLYDTLQGEDILLRLLAALGSPGPRTYYEFLKERWQREVYPAASPVPFERFFAACLHDGGLRRTAPTLPMLIAPSAIVAHAQAARAANAGSMEIALNPDPKVFDGRYANNGWLQELPDPVSKTCWSNPLSMSPADATRIGVANGDVVDLAIGAARVSAPVVVQPGQAPGVLSISLGYGRRTGSVATGIGANAWPLLAGGDGFVRSVDSIVKTGRTQPLLRSQEHFTADGRDIARVTTTGEHDAHAEPHLPSLYPDEPQVGPRWAMAIDLSACTGCGACVVACQSENNVPVVGPEQVARGRAMHWIRIDRYVDCGPGASHTAHVPILCQQCGNAPCENVCPVQATNHSPDGLNQMAYNRCVGTRYCGNNCPYKVRRFNFLDFTGDVRHPLDLARNPEVTVRPRGVMEKCTFCVQRIRNAEQVAKAEGRALLDAEIQPACAAACPAKAIVLGNANDPSSPVSALAKSPRGYRILEELGTKPSITYLSARRNP
jgi:Fe-S-cluster-containing dehydrogenase component/anaerobic selenocysteine-containing dehydrogenase